MNKIYKLQAVFMLFATLSAGNMTVQASEASAVAKIGSSEYTSLADDIKQYYCCSGRKCSRQF